MTYRRRFWIGAASDLLYVASLLLLFCAPGVGSWLGLLCFPGAIGVALVAAHVERLLPRS